MAEINLKLGDLAVVSTSRDPEAELARLLAKRGREFFPTDDKGLEDFIKKGTIRDAIRNVISALATPDVSDDKAAISQLNDVVNATLTNMGREATAEDDEQI